VTSFSRIILRTAAVLCLLPVGLTGCKANGNESPGAASQPPLLNTVASATPQSADDAPPPEKTGGFDGKLAFAHVVKQVSFGPRPSGSQALMHLQYYLQSELKSYGCNVDTDAFTADTPVGRLPMKNFLVKIPGEKPGVILLGTHYDTLLKDNFVGADDAGSSTAVMLELARLLCPQHGNYAVWIASAKLGYSPLFLNETTSAQDDHDSFLKRGIPAVDVIGDFMNNGYWHTPQDSLDKISTKTLAIVGHVFLESVKQLQSK